MGWCNLEIEKEKESATRVRDDLMQPQVLHLWQIRYAHRMHGTPSMDPQMYRAAMTGDTNGFKRVLEKEELSVSTQITPFKNTVFHLAASSDHAHLLSDILDAISSKYSVLVDTRDKKGTTPLSYAASIGYLEGVRYILNISSWAVYQSDETGSNPIHVASRKGHVIIIEELLQRFPDLVEMVNTDGQSILHVDVAAAHCYPQIVTALIWDGRVHLDSENYGGFTALDVAEDCMGTSSSFRERLTWITLRSAGVPRAWRFNEVKTRKPKQQESHDMNKYKDTVNTLLLVSTLVATVTFAAGFTLPGGYTNSDQHIGTAVVANKHMFHAYLICDTIALYSSIIVVVALIWAQLGDLALVLTALKLARPLLGVALTAMSIAFMAGVRLVVRNVIWLASFIVIMGSIFLVILSMLFIPFCTGNSSNHQLTCYIQFIPLYLRVW